MTKTKQGCKEYGIQVVEYLEYIGYSDIVLDFEPMSVAMSMGYAIKDFYIGDLSYRMAALIIYGLTMEYQVIPYSKTFTVKH